MKIKLSRQLLSTNKFSTYKGQNKPCHECFLFFFEHERCFCLLSLILYFLVNSFFSYAGMGLPGFNQY